MTRLTDQMAPGYNVSLDIHLTYRQAEVASKSGSQVQTETYSP